jgi:mono/diheme cytochrome c family protein
MQKPITLLVPMILGATVSLSGLAVSATAAEKTAPFAASALRGQLVYQKACAACHGETGNGNGQGAGPLHPKPRDFTTGIYKFRSTDLGELPTDADLLKVIAKGIPGTQMPAFNNVLTAQEQADVAAYIKKFSPDFEDAEEEAEVIEIPEAPASTAEFVAEGKNVYMALDCYTCHGPQGKGNGSAAKGLKDVWSHPSYPMNLTRPQYRSGADAANIYRTIHTGINGTPMSSFGGAFVYGSDRVISEEALSASYSAAEVQALKNYLASQPTGEAVRGLDDEAKEELTQKRKWALVHYIRSLQKKPGVLGWLSEDTELTK